MNILYKNHWNGFVLSGVFLFSGFLGVFVKTYIFCKIGKPQWNTVKFLGSFHGAQNLYLGAFLGSLCFQKYQSIVRQAAPNTEALHNPVSLMQDLKSTADSGISRPWELWVFIRLGSELDLKSLQSPALSLACQQWIEIPKLLKFSWHDGWDIMSSYIWKQCNSCQFCWMLTETAKLTQKEVINFANKLWGILRTDFFSMLPEQKTTYFVSRKECLFNSIRN